MAPRALGENAASKKRKQQQSTLTSFFATNKKSASRPAEEKKPEETSTSKENAGDSNAAGSGNDAIDDALASENLEQRVRRKREEITIIPSASSSAAANSSCSGDAEAETPLSVDSPANTEGLAAAAEDVQESSEEVPSEHQPNNEIIPIQRFGIASSSNIAHKLLYQSLHGGQRRRMVQHTKTAVSWNVTNWIQFPDYRGFRHVTQVAWDSQGDLLAAAYYNPQNGVVIAIYDWHTVSAADFAGRRRRQRGNGEAAIMEPILAIPVRNGRGAPVEVMEWNPYNPDELVVGLRASNCLYSFDLEAVNGWQGGTGGMPPCRELRCYEEGARRLPGNSGGAVINQDSCFRYLEAGKYAVLSAGTAVFCWKLGVGSWVPGTVQLHWKFQYKDTITAMTELSPETIVFGSCRGRLAILNWKKLQRSSFSVKAVPTLVDDWLSFQTDNPKNQFLTPSHPRGMGVQFLRIVKEKPSLPGRLDLLRLVWLTASGWVLSSQIEAPSNHGAETEQTVRQRTDIRRKANCKQHFATEAIKCFSDTGEQVGLAKPMWCIPTNRIPVCGTGNSIFWEKVEDNVVQRLPNQDERVLTQSHTEVRRSSKPRFLWMSFDSPDGQYPPVQTVPISKRAGQPTCTAVHSNHEWVVVGTSQNGIYLINARNKPVNRSSS